MPLIDMPVEKLKTYEGRNPRPADFDEFWDRSLAEMNAIDPEATFTPVPFPSSVMECFDLRFTSTKGARIHAKVMMATSLMDTTCPPSTQFAAYNKMNCEKSVIFYPDYAHEVPSSYGDLVFTFFSELKA